MEPSGIFEIFLADDDADDRDFFREALSEIDPEIRLTEFEDGDDLMKTLVAIEFPPDMVFLDINMPRKNGKDCLREIRGYPRFCDVPVIMFTTSTSQHDIEETYKCGASLYIRKAYSMKEEIETLKGLFREYHAHSLKEIPKNKYFVG